MAGTKAKPELRRISIATVGSRSEAEAITRKLKGAGIECFTVQERSVNAGLSPRKNFAAIKVQVRSDDVARAIHQLQTKQEADLDDPVSGAASSALKKPVLWLKSKAGWILVSAGLLLMIALGLALLLLL
jgi:hypothetical protein